MSCKAIVFTAPNKAEFIDVTQVPVGESEVCVKLHYSTLSSGTERANIEGKLNINPNGKGTDFPRRLGYSSSGEVVEVGSKVTDIKVGDLVALNWSTHTEFVTIDRHDVHKLDKDTPMDVAAIAFIASFPLAAIRKCHLEIGEPAIVMGLGILGLLGVGLLRAAGATPVIAVDPVESRRNAALKYGADYALDPTDKDFAQTVKELTNGGAKVAIEVTGLGVGLDNALDCMARMGRVALLGCTRSSDFTIDYYSKVHGPGISLIGAHTMARPDNESSSGLWTHHDDIMAAIRLHNLGRINLTEIVGEIHSPKNCAEVYTRLINDRDMPIVQFDWTKLKSKG